MKKIFLVLVGAVFGLSAGFAQIVAEGEAALVYYSPKTTITLDFAYSVETSERGIYADYAEEMLGIDNAVTENKSIYTLRNVHIGTRTETDYTRPHKVVAEPDIPLLLSISEKGLLKGYNLPETEPMKGKNQHKTSTKPAHNTDHSVAPIPEEVLEGVNELAQAHAVAKQIFHLRETKMYLLSGEVEHAPADGTAMKLVLEELDRQEKALTELFIGTTKQRTKHKFVRFAPTEEEQLFFFSEENGFTDSENIDADTIRVKMVLHPQKLAPAVVDNSKKKKKGEDVVVSQIVYNLPGSGDVEVTFDGRELGKRTVPIAQLGVDVPLSKDLFTAKELPTIVVSEKTGNIVSISK